MEAEIRNLINLIRQAAHYERDNQIILHDLAEDIKNHPDNHELIMQADEHRMLIAEADQTIEKHTRRLLWIVGSE